MYHIAPLNYNRKYILNINEILRFARVALWLPVEYNVDMTIQWWMVDGFIGLIILAAAIRGAARGIGDTFLRILGFLGGLALGLFYSQKVSAWLATTRLRPLLHNHIYKIVRIGIAEDPTGEVTSGDVVNHMLNPGATGTGSDPYLGSMPKALSSAVTGLVDKAADSAAERLTDIAISIFGFVCIMLAVWILMTILRALYRHFRRNSVVIGFMDRVLGFVLGVIRGLLLACIALAVIIPLTTVFSPDRVPEMIDAIHASRMSSIIYDINPVLLLIKHFLL